MSLVIDKKSTLDILVGFIIMDVDNTSLNQIGNPYS